MAGKQTKILAEKSFLNTLDLEGLKGYNLKNELGVTITENMSEDEVREAIGKALEKEEVEKDKEAEKVKEGKANKSGDVTFFTKYLGLHFGHLKFENGLLTTSNQEDIKFLRGSSRYNVSIFEKK